MKKLEIKKQYLHIAIIVLGIIFILIPAFHNSLWFDESYSVAISNNHNLAEIWTIGSHDVHPILYYWMLKIVSLLFGNKIIMYHIFSTIAVSILGILGYTHIRKDFGDNVGILFSFFSFFLPINLVYASEIRMYSWAMLFVAIMAIYAYRIFKGQNSIKNWVIFSVFSLASAYTHYYGLAVAGVINILLFIHFVKQSIKENTLKKDLRTFIIQGIIQAILYLPWIFALLLQVSQVSKGFWITFAFPDTLFEIFSFQFTGNLGGEKYVNEWLSMIYGILCCVYIIYLLIKNRTKKEDISPAKYAILVYGLVVLGVCLASIIMKSAIIYARYFLVITALFMFFLSFVIGKLGSKKVNIFIAIITIFIASIANIELVKINYDKSNPEPINYIKENIKEGDILIYSNEAGSFGSGFVVSANFPEYTQYFFDKENWNVEEAYKAYGPKMKTVYNLEFLQDYHGRIWFIGSTDYKLYEETSQMFDTIKLIDKQSFSTKYRNYQYTFAITEK